MSLLGKLFGAGGKADASSGEAVLEAAKSGDISALRTLGRSGADLNVKDKAQGWTALMLAAEQGHTDAAAVLIEAGADVNAKADTGITALMVAVVKEDRRLVARLLEAGADVAAREMHGKTALDIANQKLAILGRNAGTELAAVRDALSRRR